MSTSITSTRSSDAGSTSNPSLATELCPENRPGLSEWTPTLGEDGVSEATQTKLKQLSLSHVMSVSVLCVGLS